MPDWQKSDREGIRQIARQEIANDRHSPQYLAGQGFSREAAAALLKMLGGGLEDSAAMMIVSPSGAFYVQPGISEPGGTDVARP